MPKSVMFDDNATKHLKEIVGEVRANIIISRELREESSNLRQQSAELREFLRENLLLLEQARTLER